LRADVVTLALAGDVDVLNSIAKLIPADWQNRLPHNSAPYTSTIVFLVRKGNPKNIKDWDDLAKSGVSVITPNPKTSGGAQWNYLAAWEFARRKYGSDEAAKDFVAKLYKNVAVLDSGARGSTTTFVQRGIGDVFISWENEAFYAQKEFTAEVAKAYLEYLYSEEGQDIAGRNFYRPAVSETAKAKYADFFPAVELFTIDEAFGGWTKAKKDHFSDGGTFDQIYQK